MAKKMWETGRIEITEQNGNPEKSESIDAGLVDQRIRRYEQIQKDTGKETDSQNRWSKYSQKIPSNGALLSKCRL